MMVRNLPRRALLLGPLWAALQLPLAQAQTTASAAPPPTQGQVVRMAFIDPLSGPAADIGRNSLRSWQFMAERRSGSANPAGVRFLVAGFDNKGSPQESLNALKVAIDQGFRYIIQGNGSGVAAALSDAITRHNLRHPDQSVLFINYAAMDPALTNEKCSFWHFRIDADTGMKMRALTGFMAAQGTIRSVYLLNQNYAHGQQFALYFRQAMAQQRPDMQIVGDELHPPFQGVDFTSHARRIRASGAQALATGNWGADLRDLVQALQKEGLQIPVFTYYASLKGVPEVLARTGERLPVYQVSYHHTNQDGPVGALATAFRQKHGEDLNILASYDGIEMLTHAMLHVGSTDPARVAPRLSGMIFRGFSGPVHLRADDHQLQKGLYISRWQKVSPNHPRSAEDTGYTFAPVQFWEAAALSNETRCQMQRP
jgi:branched-chain amino acid transport system substrate-binding protein